jgi:hypothetical protein
MGDEVMPTPSPTFAGPARRTHGARPWLLAAAGLAVVVLLIGIGVWRYAAAHTTDPRAYPHSQIQSLDEVQRYYHLQLPACTRDTIRYAQYVQQTTDSLYVHFDGDDRCIREFRTANGLDPQQGRPTKGLPFQPSFGKNYGWPQDSEYTTLGGTLGDPQGSSLVDVLIAVDYAASPHELYLRAGIL